MAVAAGGRAELAAAAVPVCPVEAESVCSRWTARTCHSRQSASTSTRYTTSGITQQRNRLARAARPPATPRRAAYRAALLSRQVGRGASPGG
eukprot:5418773-Prymnesium_polylepis.2